MRIWCCLQDAAPPMGAAWLHHDWFLAELSLGQIRGMLRSRGLSAQGDKATCIGRLLEHWGVKRALPQIATAVALMGTIVHLRLLLLDRLPEDSYATGSNRAARAAASTSGASDRILYSLSRIGSSAPTPAAATATTAVNENKRPLGNEATGSSSPASKKAKHASTKSSSKPAADSATKAAIASGVGYGSGKPSDGGISSMMEAMHSLSSMVDNVWSAMSLPGMMGLSDTPPGMLGPPPGMLPFPPSRPATQPHNGASSTKAAVASGKGYAGSSHSHCYKQYKKQYQQQQQKQQSVRQRQEKVQKEKAACVRALLSLLRSSCTNPVMV